MLLLKPNVKSFPSFNISFPFKIEKLTTLTACSIWLASGEILLVNINNGWFEQRRDTYR